MSDEIVDHDPFDPEPTLVAMAAPCANPAMISEAAKYVDPNDFRDSQLGSIWRVMVQMADEGTAIDYWSIGAKLSTDPEQQRTVANYIGKIAWVPSTSLSTSFVALAQRIRKRATLRLMRRSLLLLQEEVEQELESTTGDVSAVEIKLAELSIEVSARSDAQLQRTTYQTSASEVAQVFDEIESGLVDNVVSTGLHGLDRKLGGGFRPGKLYCILGWTGSGKTAFASQMCDAATDTGKRSIMFSMEVDPVDIYIRDTERKAQRSRWDLKAHQAVLRSETSKKLVAAQSLLISDKGGKIVFGEPMSVEGIRQSILTEQLRGGPVALVAVDHAQVAAPSKEEKRGMPRYLAVKKTADGLRQIAKRLNVAMLLTAQMNPPPKDERPSMYQVRESKDVVNASDFVMILWHKKDESGEGDVIFSESHIILEKARAAAPGMIPIRYLGDTFTFADTITWTQGDDE